MNITNNQFKRITNQFGTQNPVLLLFTKYHIFFGRGSLIDTLDSFTYYFGIGFGVDSSTAKYPTPYFIFHEGNVLGKIIGPSRRNDLKLKSHPDAQKIIVKDFFEMMSFVDIKGYITTNEIQVLEKLF